MEVHVEKLIGRRLKDQTGKSIGRIQELIVDKDGSRYVVEEIHIGTMALLERWAVSAKLLFSGSRPRAGLIAQWDQLDLGEGRPVLTCPVADLERQKPERE